MIDYDKINEYIATMISKSGGCAQLTGVAFNDLFGAGNLVISEKDLHDGFEYIIARHKKEIEENRYATTEQKEAEKNTEEQTEETETTATQAAAKAKEKRGGR